jgi:CheY-like chemotaxis protein
LRWPICLLGMAAYTYDYGTPKVRHVCLDAQIREGTTEFMPIHIMFVDDEPNTVNLVKMAIGLDQPEWIFHSAYDGEQALQIARQTPLDFVMLDISMPGMDGIELCRRLRQLPTTAQSLIVMLTALDTPQRREQSRAAGADDFWVKPFRPTQISKDIAKLIEARAART